VNTLDLRYYERRGLLALPPRFRLGLPATTGLSVQLLRFVKRV